METTTVLEHRAVVIDITVRPTAAGSQRERRRLHGAAVGQPEGRVLSRHTGHWVIGLCISCREACWGGLRGESGVAVVACAVGRGVCVLLVL